MSTVNGPDRDTIAPRAAQVAGRAVAAVRRVLRQVAGQLDGVVTVDDLGTLPRLWTGQVDGVLLSELDAAYRTGIDDTRAAIADAARRALTAAAGAEEFVIPSVPNHQAELLLASARNRLVNVGTTVWETARGQLLDGLQAGEGIRKLRERVQDSAGLSARRAELVARTEVNHAMNQGSLAQMGALGVPVTKTWIATMDARTRPEHAEVNGETAALNDLFSNGENPGDAPNCRCTLGYDLPDEDLTALAAEEPEALTTDQYTALAPGRKTERSVVSALESTAKGKNVLSMIRGFTEKRGGVARLRQQVGQRLAGEQLSKTLTAKIDDFIGAMNGYDTTQIPSLYRGFAVKMEANTNAWWDAFEARYQVGQRMQLNASSFTSSAKKAQEFQTSLGGTRTVSRNHVQVRFEVDAGDAHALPVEVLSKFASEKEWISGGEFTVTEFSPASKARPYYLVKLRQTKQLGAP